MRVQALLLAALAGGLFASASAETITTVFRLRMLTDEDYAKSIPFCITGLVTVVSGKSLLLEADDGGYSVQPLVDCRMMHEGDILCTSGHTALAYYANDPILYATNIVLVGHADVPEPPLMTLEDILSGKGDYRRIRLAGFFTDAFNDNIDDNYIITLLNVQGRILHAATLKSDNALNALRSLANTDVEVTCVLLPHMTGRRLFGGPIISFKSVSHDVRPLSRPTGDPFDAPSLKTVNRTVAERISALKRHSVHGRVLATWQRRNLIVSYGENRLAKVTLADGEQLPAAGTWIDAVGFPETDLFTVNLANAQIRPAKGEPAPAETPDETSAYQICHNPITNSYDLDFHGRLVRLAGTVCAVSGLHGEPGRLTVESDGVIFAVDAGTSENALGEIETGCQIEATGVCIMESESWSPQRIVPAITGFAIVLRAPDGIRIVSRPPWWTPRRLVFVLSGILLALVAILVWNMSLRKLVERRSRQLLKSQAEKINANFRIDERTRIATELHDYLAQNLTAMSYQLTAARLSQDEDPATSQKHLETVATMLNSSRTELRRCLWDLKSDALEESTFEQAIRRTLQQILDDTPLSISFDLSRRSVNDSTAHALLSVIRELVANAIHHGHAKSISITGGHSDGKIVVSVSDDGAGFDPSKCMRSDDGHFGLDGIRSRLARLGGEFAITSSPGRGTTAVIRLPLPDATPRKSKTP
ncbi:MAG: sensor histidine kinase [Kiritimatiellae bacterium]|nr:sensor histidine kinase [Kiritimatiellia bacterium]MBQ6329355.1 sensor histidine kinase [Kiritimatiellia bacterium]